MSKNFAVKLQSFCNWAPKHLEKYRMVYFLLCFWLLLVGSIAYFYRAFEDQIKDIFTKIKSKFKKNEEVESE